MSSGRLQNSMKNLISGFVSRFIIILLGMVVRTFFIRTLGNAYLSVNGLYTNILSMLSLAEMGFGTAMVYSMYKPLANNDQDKLSSLMVFYKKVYRVIGFVILCVGLCIVPFMDYIIKDPPNISHLTFYYVIFLFNSVLSYWFFAFKRSILIADQKEYVCTNYHNLFNMMKSIIQIVALVVFENFTIYLFIQLGFTVVENLFVAKVSDKAYPALHKKKINPLSKTELRDIWSNVKALMLSKLGHVILNSTDNIIISSFVGVSWVGLLSNFTLIVDSVTGVLCQVTSALSASLGNYFAKENKEDSYRLFERIEFLNSWLYGFSAICLLVLLNPFVALWIGEEYTLSIWIVAALSLNFFVQGYMNTLWTFRSTLGLFKQGWIRPLIVAIVNIIASIILGMRFGTFGVLFATFLARASINLWYDPWVIHKYGFERSVKPFFKMYFLKVIEIGSIIVAVTIVKYFLLQNGVTIWKFIALMFSTVIIMLGAFWIYSHRREEYMYFHDIFKGRFLPWLKLRLKK